MKKFLNNKEGCDNNLIRNTVLFLPVLIALIFQFYYSAYLQTSLDPDAMPQISAYFPYEKDSNITADFFDKYYLDVHNPPFYSFLMKSLSHMLGSKNSSYLIQYLTFGISIILAFLVCRKIFDKFWVVPTVIIIISTNYIMFKSFNGLPRSFGYPLILLSLWAAQNDKFFLMAASCILASLLYPVISPILGIFLFFNMLNKCQIIFKDDSSGKKKIRFSPSKIILLLLTASISLFVIYLQYLNSVEYGEKVFFDKESPIFLRNGISQEEYYSLKYLTLFLGFLFPMFILKSDFLDLQDHLIKSYLDYNYLNLFELVVPLFALTFFICFMIQAQGFLNWKEIFLKNEKIKPLFLFTILATLLSFVSVVFSPSLYYPDRVLDYFIPILSIIFFMLILEFLGKKYGKKSLLIAFLFLILAINSYSMMKLFKQYDLGEEVKELSSFISKNLSTQDVILALPERYSITDQIKFLTKKKVFVANEYHQTFHKHYLEEVEKRFYSSIDFYFASSKEEISDFLKDFPYVNYLIIDKNHFSKNKVKFHNISVEPILDEEETSNIQMFEPFYTYAKEKYDLVKRENKIFIITEIFSNSVIFENERYQLIDLKRN